MTTYHLSNSFHNTTATTSLIYPATMPNHHGLEIKMTTYTNRTVNQVGLDEIAEFLGTHHRLGRGHFAPDMLRAWAGDAEFQMAEGNDASIEIKSWDAISGHTETFSISDAGIDSEEIEIDE